MSKSQPGRRVGAAAHQPIEDRHHHQVPQRATQDAAPRRSAPPDQAFRTRHPVLTALVPVGLVVAAIATMVVIKAAGATCRSRRVLAPHGGRRSSADGADPGTTALSRTVAGRAVGPGRHARRGGQPLLGRPAHPVGSGTGPVLQGADGKPLITYVGAEYCPYCAAERWALAVALSRFGTFSNLSGTHSSGTDVYPDTQTLSFYGSSYSSPYVDFQAVEEATNQQVGGTYQTLQTPTAAQSALMATYDPQGSIPFLDIANRYVITGSSFSPQVLQGLSRGQIARAAVATRPAPVAQAIDGAANDITAAIASVTGQPAQQRGELGRPSRRSPRSWGRDDGDAATQSPRVPPPGCRHASLGLSLAQWRSPRISPWRTTPTRPRSPARTRASSTARW